MTRPRILIADDNPLSLRFLTDALAAMEAECVGAEDGTAALRLALGSAFDLLLLDARMPGLDGTEVLARTRAQAGPSQHAVALATTAENSTETAVNLRAAGFTEVLVKPIGIDALQRAATRHLSAFAATLASDELDDEQARRAAGGDVSIMTALRDLFARELEALPAEFAAMSEQRDKLALRDRLHRLDASAGFCGAPAVVRAAATLRQLLDGEAWPAQGIADFLAVGERARECLAMQSPS